MEPDSELKGHLSNLRLWDGKPFPKDLKAELKRELKRLEIVESQISTLKKKQQNSLKKADTPSSRKVLKLSGLCGIGNTSSWVFVKEFLGWRHFNNRRELASAAGLAPTPYDSGNSQREQGISKAGNRRIRAMLVEISWCWLRYQPDSELSLWFKRRHAGGGSRSRRIGIVAVARRLLIALWRYLEKGVVPAGAVLKNA